MIMKKSPAGTGLLNKNIFTRIKEYVDFEEVANEHGINFDKSNKAPCPYHDESTPSFHNYKTHGYCFGCGKYSDVIDLEAHFKDSSYFEAALSLAKRYKIDIPLISQKEKLVYQKQLIALKLIEKLAKEANKNLKKHPNIIKNLEGKRGLDKSQLDKYLIGYVGNDNPLQQFIKKGIWKKIAREIGIIDNKGRFRLKNRIMYPVWNYGKITNICSRAYPDRQPKFLHLSNSELICKELAFQENLLKEECIVTESISDAIALLKIDIPACAMLGVNPGDKSKDRLSTGRAKLYFWYDSDDTGREAANRLAKEFKGHVIDSGEQDDPDKILAIHGDDKFKEFVLNSIENAVHYLDKAIENENVETCLELISNIEMSTEKEIALKKLRIKHKSEGVTLVSLRQDLKDISHKKASITTKDTHETKEKNYIAICDDLIDIVEHEGQVKFLVKENGKLKLKNQVEIDGNNYLPPPKDSLPFNILPRAKEVLKSFASDTDEQLFDDLVKYHKKISELPDERYYHLLAIWDFHTYLQESFIYSPIIWLYAVAERGKTRTGKGCTNVAYRGFHTESLREAYLLRTSTNLNTSTFIDVMDLAKKAERANSEDIILGRFEKGFKVPRVLYPDKGAHQDIVYYQVYGPTIIATNKPLHEIMETRTLKIAMPESNKKFEFDVTAENGLPFKERLVAFRGRNLDKTMPLAEKPFRGRLGDMVKPLLQVLRLVKPKNELKFLQLMKDIESERKLQLSESLEANILRVIISERNMISKGLLPVKIITKKYNDEFAGKFTITPQKNGRVLDAMGFRKSRTNAGSQIKWDLSLIIKLCQKYGVAFSLKKRNEQGSTKLHEAHKQHRTSNSKGSSGDVSGVVSLKEIKTSLEQH